ncbi:hypothetical protein O6H91_01G021500 [Diphasiastrum complanatum]|uniref:Uncharacterized protein n=1 Tax=Diphasiastrum complanatum TaxID=34168 RepID=A0ACC2ENX4_DIPCM|nr:hypothetical protein O6H91_01G021500 [Diphasiastrum complanatum]
MAANACSWTQDWPTGRMMLSITEDLTKECRWVTQEQQSEMSKGISSRYTSLSDIMQTQPSFSASDSFGPRTPIKNQLVEKAAMAYLRPNHSFSRHTYDGRNWTTCSWRVRFGRLVTKLLIVKLPNPYHLFRCAVQFADICLRSCIACT